MDWLFETQNGTDLSDTISSGLAHPTSFGDEGVDHLRDALSHKGTGFDDDMQFGRGDYDTMITLPGDDGDPDPEEPPVEPPLDPPTHPEPLTPTGPVFDYSELLTVADFLSWLEWLGDSGPTSIGGGNYDSLAEFMNGEWHFDVDPELIDTGGFYGDHNSGGYINYGQFGTTNALIGFHAANGAVIPIFREWTEIVQTPAEDGDNLPGYTVIHHTDFLGYRASNTYQIASLDGPQDWLGRAEGVMNLADVVSAYQNLLEGAQGEENTVAIGEPFVSQANGMLMAEVTLNGTLIGHVQVGDSGFRLFDRNGNLIASDRPLTQNWDQTGGVAYWETMAHQERTMSIPFAQALMGFATVVTGGSMGFLSGLGFSFASGVVSGGSAANATAYARLLEAAFELRLIELRSRNGN